MTLQSAAAAPKVIVVTPWYGGNEGGVAVVTESLVQSLVQDGVPCAAIVVAPDGWLPKHAWGQSGEEIVAMCLRDRPAATSFRSRCGARIHELLAIRAFKKLLPADGRRCVVHLHYSLPEYSFFTELCAKLGIPMVSTFHGSDLSPNLEDARTLAVTRRLVNQSKVVTAVSHALRQATLEWFPEISDHTVVVHNAVPPDFARALEGETTSAERDIDVLYVGNLIPRKGVDILLHAWKQVLTTFELARLTIAGGGDDAPMLAALARELGIDHAVSFRGRQSRAALPALYRRAKVLAVPSRAEPLGVVVLEGMLCGAAVVATETGGIPEIIVKGKHGLLVPTDNAPLLADGLVRLLGDDALRTTLAMSGQQRVLQDFSAQGIATQYRAVYQRALEAT